MQGWKKLTLFACAIVLGMTVAAGAQSLESNDAPLGGCLTGVCGACCLPDGGCTETDSDDCAAQGGDFQDDGSLCENFGTVCEPFGACCLDGGQCSTETRDFCEGELGGVYQGDGTFCGDTGIECGGPPNDECENAIALPLGTLVEGTTEGANDDPLCTTGALESNSPGVWFSVIGDGGMIAATTCVFTSELGDQTAISVFCSCNNLTCVASGSGNCTEELGDGAFVEWCSEPGVEYRILVSTFGFEGPFMLNVFPSTGPQTCLPAVSCAPQSCGADHCGDAGSVCPYETYLVDTSAATSDFLDHGGTIDDVFFCGGFFSVYDVWCKYTPAEDGLLFVHVEGPGDDGTEWVFGVYDGCTVDPDLGGEPNLLACNTFAHHGVIVWEVQAFQTYWIRSAARNFGRGEFIMDIVGPPCANGVPAEAQGPDPCALDVTGDGIVDMSDLAKVLREATPCADPRDCPSDVNSDGTVDAKDVTSVLARLGSVCES